LASSALVIVAADRERRRATVRIPEVGDIEVEPIKDSVTGEEHRARIVVPQGFEFQEAEMGNAVVLRANAGDRVRCEHHHTYTQLCARLEPCLRGPEAAGAWSRLPPLTSSHGRGEGRADGALA
jgi:hypothetical protein